MPPSQLIMAEMQNESGKKKKTNRKGSPRNSSNSKNMRTRSFSRSPPDSPVRGVCQKGACFVTYSEGLDAVLEKLHVGIQAVQDNFAGRLSPSKVEGRWSVANCGSSGCVGGYNAVQPPAPSYLPPPPPSWMVTNFKVAENVSYMPEEVGNLSTHLKMLLKVQG